MKQRWYILAALALLPVIAAAGDQAAEKRHDALVQLRNGNTRHMEGQVRDASTRGDNSLSERQPVACVVACSDMAAPVEDIFDQRPEDLYVVRLAGPVMPAEVVASVEYAVEQWGMPLVVVLGHTPCEAVEDAVVSQVESYTGPALSVLSRLQRAVSAARHKGFSDDEIFTAAVSENARMGAQALLDGSRLIEEAVLADSLIVLAAVYDESTGQVKWLTQVTAAAVASQAALESAKSVATAAPAKSQAAVQTAEKKANGKKEEKKTVPQTHEEESSTYARRHR